MGPSYDDIEKYKAAMVLSGVGDAIGYKNQEWEYCKSGPTIHEQLKELGGLEAITACLPDWPVSDDTVMHIATAEGLCCEKETKEDMYLAIAAKYKECMNDMEGRKPGPSSMKGCDLLKPDEPKGYQIPFDSNATGCGAAMRSMCIGLRYPRVEDVDELVADGIECGRMTHHHPIGYLGSLTSAAFTAYALQGKPTHSWGRSLVVDILPRAWKYVNTSGFSVNESKKEWNYFGDKWRWYLEQRGIMNGTSEPTFPCKYGVEERDKVYATFSLDGWAGRSGHDAPMIAYDALLSCGDSWTEMCNRALFHAGDSDSTGVIAACCFGAMYGYLGVPECNHETLEYRDRLEALAVTLYDLSHKSKDA